MTTYPVLPDAACSGPYDIILESKVLNPDGTYTWTCSISNPHPGSGDDGTAEDLAISVLH